MARITITQLAKELPDDEAAYEFLERMLWKDQPVCPHCGSINDHYFLTPKGDGRKTRTGTISARRVWCCKDCRKQFSVLTGTIFHGTRVNLRTWIFVLFEMTSSKNGVAAREIARKYGLAPKTAWLMTQKIRSAMDNTGWQLMVGTIVADETWIGGKPGNRHANKKHVPEGMINNESTQVPVLCLINADTGESRSRVVADVSGDTLREAMAEQVDKAQSDLMTDQAGAYKRFAWEWQSHQAVNHSEGEYVRDQVSTNKAENFFSQLKRSIDGTHHAVSREHLNRYLGEFDFRYSTRTMDDTERMGLLVTQARGVRVTYKRIKR
ncbi:MAG: IS1595 family transposase [Acidimicrobiales bacterium]|jgi:transposase-like protein